MLRVFWSQIGIIRDIASLKKLSHNERHHLLDTKSSYLSSGREGHYVIYNRKKWALQARYNLTGVETLHMERLNHCADQTQERSCEKRDGMRT